MNKQDFMLLEDSLKSIIQGDRIKSFEELKEGLRQGNKVILGGMIGCGKSYLCDTLKQEMDNIIIFDYNSAEHKDVNRELEKALKATGVPVVITCQGKDTLECIDDLDKYGYHKEALLGMVDGCCYMVHSMYEKFIVTNIKELRSILAGA